MATRKRTGDKENQTSYEHRQRDTGYPRGDDRYGAMHGYDDEEGHDGPSYRGYERGRYPGRDYNEFRRDDRDDYDYPDQNFNWRSGDDRWGHQHPERRSGYYPAGVQGNRNESRGEGYGGYGRQSEDGNNRAGERFDDDDRFYHDRGYSRGMYARNDRSYRWDDNDRRYREERYARQDWRDDRFREDPMPYRDDYRYRDPRREDRYDGGGRYGYDEYANRERQPRHSERDERSGGERKQRVVGRGMYGNHPSGRYGNYGDDTMHGNMGGGDWRGNNEYQVGGGAGYQPSDAGTYGSYSGAGDTWDEDRAPGRKKAATGGQRSSSKKSQKSAKNTGNIPENKNTATRKAQKDQAARNGRNKIL